jgi:hypothetical protein
MGNDHKISNPHVWDYTTLTTVKIEMSPQKSKEQLLKNYHKNKDVYEQIRFVVTSLNHEQLAQILGEDQPADPVKYRVDVMEFESLNTIEPKPQEESKVEEEPPSANRQVDAEEKILSYIKEHGFTTREEIAHECKEAGIEIGPRQVSRYLKILTEKRLLRREGKRYAATQLLGNQ